MDKPSTLKQLYDLCEPYAAPVFGMFIALARFWKNHTKEIDKKFESIQIDVAVLKEHNKESDKKQDKIEAKIDHINEMVQEMKEELMKFSNAKFSEYDRKFAIIFNRQKRQSR